MYTNISQIYTTHCRKSFDVEIHNYIFGSHAKIREYVYNLSPQVQHIVNLFSICRQKIFYIESKKDMFEILLRLICQALLYCLHISYKLWLKYQLSILLCNIHIIHNGHDIWKFFLDIYGIQRLNVCIHSHLNQMF